MKILVGVPHSGTIPWEFFESFIRLNSIEITPVGVAKSCIHIARQKIAELCMKENFDYLLFIDSDMTFPPDIVERLLAHDAPIVSAMCFKRVPPYSPCFYEKCERKEDNSIYLKPFDFDEVPTKPFIAEAAGTACMLIKREVFEKIQQPWFFPDLQSGEDIIFCLRAKAAGIPILIDPAPIIGHVESREVNVFTYLGEKILTEGAI